MPGIHCNTHNYICIRIYAHIHIASRNSKEPVQRLSLDRLARPENPQSTIYTILATATPSCRCRTPAAGAIDIVSPSTPHPALPTVTCAMALPTPFTAAGRSPPSTGVGE